MNHLFSANNKLMGILEKIMNLAILNICFLIGCIPIVTVGAALTALFCVNLRMVRGEESYVFRSYWKAFRKNFRQSTLLWLITLVIGSGVFLNIYASTLIAGTGGFVFKIIASVLAILYAVFLIYIFAYAGWFEDRILTCIKNSMMIGICRPAYTFVLLFMQAAVVFVHIADPELLIKSLIVWIVIGFALLNYIQSYFIRILFSKYEDAAADEIEES